MDISSTPVIITLAALCSAHVGTDPLREAWSFHMSAFTAFSGDGKAAFFLGHPRANPASPSPRPLYGIFAVDLRPGEGNGPTAGDLGASRAVVLKTGEFEPSLGPIAVSGDGSVVAYEGNHSGLLVVWVAEPGGGGRSMLMTKSAKGEPANEMSFCPSLSADGEVMAFCSDADNLVSGDTNGETDIFVTRLRLSGKKKRVPEFDIARVNVSEAGEQANASSGGWLGWHGPSLSANGRFVAFPSAASNLVPGDRNDLVDIFVRDLESEEIVMVSRSLSGNGGNGHSNRCVLSATGEHIAFTSMATDLLTMDVGPRAQVYAWNRSTRQTVLISKGPDGSPANRGCSGPSISDDGRFIAFKSSATNLCEDPVDDDTVHLFVGDRDPDRDGEYQSDSMTFTAVRVPRRAEVMGDLSCYYARLSGDGEWIGFEATFPLKGKGSNARRGSRGVILVPVHGARYRHDR